jgi:hypothetical protein
LDDLSAHQVDAGNDHGENQSTDDSQQLKGL